MSIKRQFEKAKATLEATLANGARLVMDQELRQFFKEYTNRLWNHGPDSMPTSFNLLRPFYWYDRELLMLRLQNERDHLFSFSDFVDFGTSKDAPNNPFDGANSIPDNTVHSFTNLDDPHDITFATDSGAEYGVGGLSFIREADQLTVMLMGGKVTDLDVETQHATATEYQPAMGRSWVRSVENLKHGAVPLQGTQDMWKTLVGVRFDLKKKNENVRYVLQDVGNSFIVVTDDPQIVAEGFFGKPDEAERYISGLREYQVLFELCKTAILLPSYFAFKITLVKNEERTTNLGHVPPQESHQTQATAPRPAFQEKVVYRKVAALRIVGFDSIRTVRRFTPPQFQVEVEGFWRRLRPDSIGRDASGNPVVGRTWISSHLRWRSQPNKPIEVLVKSRVSVARAIVAAEAQIAAMATTEPSVVKSIGPSESADEPTVTITREEAYRERAKLTKRLRWKILERDNFRCTVCGAD